MEEAYATLQTASFAMLELQLGFPNFWANGCRFFNAAGPDGERTGVLQVL